jgi:hypothetical protein
MRKVERNGSIVVNDSFLVNNIQAPSTRPPCPTGSTESSTDNNGFYACIYTGGNRVDLFLYGRLSDNRTPANTADDEIMLVESTVYTRSRTF